MSRLIFERSGGFGRVGMVIAVVIASGIVGYSAFVRSPAPATTDLGVEDTVSLADEGGIAEETTAGGDGAVGGDMVVADAVVADTRDGAELLEIAGLHRQSKEYGESEQIYRGIVERYPGTDYALSAQSGLARTYIFMERWSEAKSVVQQLRVDFADNPGLQQALSEIGTRYMLSGRYAEAEAVFQGIVTDYPGSDYVFRGRWKLATIYVASANFTKAQSVIDRLLTDFAGHLELPDALYKIAWTYRRANKHAEAIAFYKMITEDYADSDVAGDALKCLLLCYHATNNIEQAQAAITELPAEFVGRADFPDSCYRIAKVLMRSGEPEKAKRVYEEIIRRQGDASVSDQTIVRSSMADIHLALDFRSDAEIGSVIRGFLSDLQRYPELQSLAYNVALKCENETKFQIAKDIYEHIPSLYPDYVDKKNLLPLGVRRMDILIGIETGGDGLAEVSDFIDDFAGHPRLALEVTRGLGEKCYQKAHKMQQADLHSHSEYWFRKAAEIFEIAIDELWDVQATPEACWMAGESYAELGDHARAVDCYQKVNDFFPDYKHVWHADFMMGRCLENLKASGEVSPLEADRKIKAAYERITVNYPECDAAEGAQEWLNNYYADLN